MNAPASPRILADTGGLVVTDDGRRVNVIDRATGGLAVLVFVLAVLAVVIAGSGVATLVTGDSSILLGSLLLAAGFATAVLALLAVRKIRQRRSRPLGECRSVAVLDRKLNLFTVAGGALLPLDQIRFERRLQLGSSSPKLVAISPQGVHVLKRGNPFDGHVGTLDAVLTEAGRGQSLPA